MRKIWREKKKPNHKSGGLVYLRGEINGRKAKGVSENLDRLWNLGEYTYGSRNRNQYARYKSTYGKQNSKDGGDGGENERQFNSWSTDESDEGSNTDVIGKLDKFCEMKCGGRF